MVVAVRVSGEAAGFVRIEGVLMSSREARRIAKILADVARNDSDRRTRQLPASSVPLDDGVEVSVVDSVIDAVDARTDGQTLAEQVTDLSQISDWSTLDQTFLPERLGGSDASADAGFDTAVGAAIESKFAKGLAEDLGLNLTELSDDVLIASAAASNAQTAADAAQTEAETARAEATSKSAAAEAAAKLYAEAQAAAAEADAIAAASGDATTKANAAKLAAEAAAALDATAKANAAEAAAKLDAANAQTTATNAANAAAAAQTAAGNAVSLASQAQTTASGKNKTYRDTVAPAGVGTSEGDKWEQYDTLGAGGKLQGTWAWTGSAWVSTVLSETYLPLVDIGSGTYGTLAGARLAATAIDGMTITGALIRTAASGQRMQLDETGLRSFSSTNIETARLSAGSGAMEVVGSLVSRVGATGLRASLNAGALVLDNQDSTGSVVLDRNSLSRLGAGLPFKIGHDSAGANSPLQLYSSGSNLIEFLNAVSFHNDTNWSNVTPSGATGKFRWRRFRGIIFFEYDIGFTTTLPAGDIRTFGTLPTAARPATVSAVFSQAAGVYPMNARVNTNGTFEIRNPNTGGAGSAYGSGFWVSQ